MRYLNKILGPLRRYGRAYRPGQCRFTSGVSIWDELVEPRGQKVELRTTRPGFVTWYACGPTVYDSAHIGHASSYIRLDVIRRILERQNVSVVHVMGITDIDDKIIAKARQENVSWDQIGKKYEAEFFNDMGALNIKSPHFRARVSDFIPHIINFIADLLSAPTPVAYTTADGSVYFDTQKYGGSPKFRRAQNDAEPLIVDSDLSSEKRDRRDFALWKGSKPGEPFWSTPWGKGRPGWHIECSVMASYFFGQSLDIHSGGVDLIFPHHENEETQCCAKFGQQKWVTHWIHTGHLHLGDDVKMSKSLGNTLKISDFLQTSSPEALRMLCILSRYYTDIEYSAESVKHATLVLSKFNTFLAECNAVVNGAKKIQFRPGSLPLLWETLISVKSKMDAVLIDNFDTPSAVKLVSDAMGEFNRNIETDIKLKISSGFDCEIIVAYRAFVQDFLSLMGLSSKEQSDLSVTSTQLLEPVLSQFITFRKSVRMYSLALDEEDKKIRQAKVTERKDLIQACDQIRDNLGEFGIEVKDYGTDSSWNFKTKLDAIKSK